MLFELSLGIYNSAGEVVRVLYQGAACVSPGALSLDQGTLALGQGEVHISIPGTLADGSSALPWDGSNANGQSVNGGIYSVKMETIDPFGKVTATILAISVIDTRPQQALEVFNAAGERVRSIALPAQVGMSGFDLGADTLLVGDGAGSGLKIDLRTGQGSVFASQWDGKNDAGAWVTSGIYSIALVSRQGSEGVRVMIKSVQVLRAPEEDVAAEAHPWQNPVPVGQGQIAIVYPSQPGLHAQFQLFNLSGEKVTVSDDDGGSGFVSAPEAGLSAGVYLAVLQVRSGGELVGKKTLKLAIVR